MIGKLYKPAQEACRVLLTFLASRRVADIERERARRDAVIMESFYRRLRVEERAAQARRIAQGFDDQAAEMYEQTIQLRAEDGEKFKAEHREIETLRLLHGAVL